MEENHRIKFALYSPDWEYAPLKKAALRKSNVAVPPSEYAVHMRGHIFCPECCVPLFKSPEHKKFDSSGRPAFYSHSPTHRPPCSLRVKQAEGKRYINEEEAKEAVENGELVIVKGFLQKKPVPPAINGPIEYGGPVIEDEDGGITEVAIGRHNGEKFPLPATVTTIRGLCRNFDENLYRYFFFPHQVAAVLLHDLLIDLKTVRNVDEQPRLYFGKIRSSINMGKTPRNIRQTFFEYPKNYDCADFCLKVTDEQSQEHGIDDDSKGKIVLMYGAVVESGVGLCLKNLGWGEFAVLPPQYNYLLDG